MIYRLELAKTPFALIKSKKKTIEMRIVKENRKDMIPGDYIYFKDEETFEEIKALITFVHFYKDFEDLYSHEDVKALGYEDINKASYKDMYVYYSKEQIQDSGVMAIGIALL